MAYDGKIAVERVLLSAYYKTGLVELARGLHKFGVELVSTGGTARTIRKAGIPVTDVAEVTDFPEMLDGRVKTMHPRLLGGVLAEQDKAEHLRALAEHNIELFQMVICNLYPFEETVASGAGMGECVEQIDIGGPTMVRAAAKNHASVAVVTDPANYDEVLAAVKGGGFTLNQRRCQARDAFRYIAEYDMAIANWMGESLAPDDVDGLPAWIGTVHVREQVLPYGENQHQKAAKYKTKGGNGGIANALQYNGKPMSRNNYWDGHAAWREVNIFTAEPAVVIVKHTTPCGVAVCSDVAEAYRKALACDPISASGGVVAVNREVTVELAKEIMKIFTEVVLAPSYADGALEVLATKPNLRVLEVTASTTGSLEYQPIDGGLLVQTVDNVDQPGDDPSGWTLKSGNPADEATLADLHFAWRAVVRVKSNAILVAADGASIGIGTGQPNRVDSFRDAVRRAGDQITKCVLASDAFIPFADGAQVAIDAGVKAIVEPGGSVRDNEIIELCEKHGVTLYFTGVRHFAH